MSAPSSKSTAASIFELYKGNVQGKTVIVTGCTSGIGRETVVQLVAHGAEVVMGCRSEEAMRGLEEEVKVSYPDAKLHSLKLDLSSMKSVQEFCTNFIKLDFPLNILICNAGAVGLPYTLTEEGFETLMATNHFGHMLMVLLLKEKLVESQPSRVVVVASEAHRFSNKDGVKLNYLNQEKSYGTWAAYGHTKLANVLFAKELNKRLEGKGVTAYSVHPGVVATDITRHFGVLGSIFRFVSTPFCKSIPQGAATTAFCAAAEPTSLDVGGYHGDCAPLAASEQGRSEKLALQLWEESMDMLKQKGFLPAEYMI
jgi:retinol dehydrogenase-12